MIMDGTTAPTVEREWTVENMTDRCPTNVYYEFHGIGTEVCPYPCQNKTEYGYCKTTGCINPKFDRTRTFTWYDPIEIARQYAPKFDKPEVEVAEVRHGHWVDGIEDFQGMSARIMRCSVCGKARPMAIFSNEGFVHNYCANCGAKMEGDDEKSM